MVHTFLHNFPTLLHISIRNLAAIGNRQCTIVERVTTISVRIRITVPTFDGKCYSSKTNAFDYFIIKTISQGFTYKCSTLRAQAHWPTTDYSLCLRSSLVFEKKIDFNWIKVFLDCYKNGMQQNSDSTIAQSKFKSNWFTNGKFSIEWYLFAFISIDFWREKKTMFTIWRRTAFRAITKPNAKLTLNAVRIGGNANTNYYTVAVCVVGMTLRSFCLCMGVTDTKRVLRKSIYSFNAKSSLYAFK